MPPPIFVFPFYPFFWTHEISIWVLGGFSRLKKFLQGRKTVFPASRNFFKAENLYFRLREISRSHLYRFSGFAKIIELVWPVRRHRRFCQLSLWPGTGGWHMFFRIWSWPRICLARIDGLSSPWQWILRSNQNNSVMNLE